MKLRCDRHKKACKNCKINRGDNILTCPCLNVDNSPKGSRCEYFEREEEVQNGKDKN